jgi:hypothetical protein
MKRLLRHLTAAARRKVVMEIREEKIAEAE